MMSYLNSYNTINFINADLVPDEVESMDGSIIRFSKVWEDFSLLQKALDVGSNDVVVSITR